MTANQQDLKREAPMTARRAFRTAVCAAPW
jgi:hypothetical protein